IHTAEGEDDMSAHVRTLLTETTLTIPVTNDKLALGTWQGVYVWEHRARSHKRSIVVTVLS
ncbi:MAG: YjbQ family protein, partial [Clostridia bacterium]|nr:YjbQ family protein [Deltaproteobacteria bacterium]